MLCTDESQDELLQNYALRYLYEVFGSDCVRNEVVPLQVNNCSSRYIMYVEMSQGSRCVKSCRISLRSQRVLN